jgi:hypothetical protein
MGRIPDRADLAVVSEGGGPVVALVEKLLGDDQARSALAQLLRLVEKPWAIGFGLDVAEARAAAAALRGGVTDPKKLAAVVTGGLETHSWLASSVDVATVEATMRAAAKSAPTVLTSATLQVRAPAPAARLPRGSFVLDVTRGTPKQKTFFVFVPDGTLTWAMSGSDEARVARFATRVLATSPATRPDLHIDATTVVSASVWDEAGAPWRSLDPLPSTPAGRADAAQAIESALAAPPSALHLAFVREAAGAAKAATLRLSGSGAVAGKLAANLAGSLFSVVFLLSMLASAIP